MIRVCCKLFRTYVIIIINYRMAKTAKQLNANLDYMNKVKSRISMEFDLFLKLIELVCRFMVIHSTLWAEIYYLYKLCHL